MEAVKEGLMEDGGRPLDKTGLISTKQLKAIWALSHRARLQEEDLRILVEWSTGKKSIRSLSKQEAQEIIEDLLIKAGGKELISQEVTDKEGRITRAQMVFMGALSNQIGWDQWRVLRLAQRMYGIRQLKDLKLREASGLIEALKAMKRRRAA
ncbi:MAG TPA: phage protein GemA/Gp16 family protein [Nitrospiria bacterium]|nr:phage protein GemA/Gp16 family protein [Nitrospiria bacterium]